MASIVREQISKIRWPKIKEVLALARTTLIIIIIYALLFTLVQLGMNALI